MTNTDTHSASLVKRYRSLVDSPSDFEAAMHTAPSRFFWVHPLRTSPETLCPLLRRDGYHLETLPWQPGGFRVQGQGQGLGRHWAYHAGLFHIQDAASMMPARLLDPAPGHQVLDLCAAPGNKTAQLSLSLLNTGTVVANDYDAQRLRPLVRNVTRLGLLNVSTTQHNGTDYPPESGPFDRILVDAPCSGEGTARRHPHLLQRKRRPSDVLQSVQYELLRRAVCLCRVGGRIVYSTCTFAPEENERVVNAVLGAFSGRVRLLSAHRKGLPTSPGVTHWREDVFDERLEKTARIWPHLNDTDGFYMALMEKVDETPPAIQGGFDTKRTCQRSPLYESLQAKASVQNVLSARFGIPAKALETLRLVFKSEKHVHAVARDHRPPPGPLVTLGLPLLNLRLRFPKLTTAGALAVGHWATRNVVDVDEDQAYAYLERRSLLLSARQRSGCRGDGYVLVRHKEYVLGVGLLFEDRAEVLSYYPKAFALPPRRPA
ncbi:MAG: RsmB/NOP family class I SAM-dependent RNA methyltransferase [Desulfobacteraceae bacterium]|nr:RsmB/NOP family class I SAM-dependent RNA methyltransferase [Desulfobacteraceae bacterium]